MWQIAGGSRWHPLSLREGVRFSGVLGSNICFKSTHDAELPGYIIELKDGAWNKFDAVPANAC